MEPLLVAGDLGGQVGGAVAGEVDPAGCGQGSRVDGPDMCGVVGAVQAAIDHIGDYSTGATWVKRVWPHPLVGANGGTEPAPVSPHSEESHLCITPHLRLDARQLVRILRSCPYKSFVVLRPFVRNRVVG